MQTDRSLKRALTLQKNFIPPYCARPSCPFHQKQNCISLWYKKNGLSFKKSFPYQYQRYQCLHCKKHFTYSFFKLSYREQLYGLDPLIFRLNICGASNREIARFIGHSEHFVRLRLSKLARWCLLKQSLDLKHFQIQEPIVYDGLENFSFSQYDPNNINHAIGKHSGFTYDFNFSPMNRKGKMSERQKEFKCYLDKQFGKYPPKAIRKSSEELFKRLVKKNKDQVLILYSDEHFQYRRAIERDLRDLNIVHLTISSKASRNFQNPLFNVNNFDMQIRQKSAAFMRETISFAKHSIGMVEKFTLFMAFKNYMRPYFYKKQVRDPHAHEHSPAQRAGVEKRILSFREFFKERTTLHQVDLSKNWEDFVKRRDPLSRRVIQGYKGI